MSEDIAMRGSITITRFGGFCEGCGLKGITYQVTSSTGRYVQLCAGCFGHLADEAENDLDKVRRAP